jgi:glutamyl-tRNA synthetase
MSWLDVDELSSALGLYTALFSTTKATGEVTFSSSDEEAQWQAALKQPHSSQDLLNTLEGILSTRTYLVGYSKTSVDTMVLSELVETKADDSSFPAVKRWRSTIEATSNGSGKGGDKKSKAPSNGGARSDSNVQAAEKNATTGGGGGGDTGSMPALENAEKGKVVMRFPPEPSGYLHIGHVKAVLLNNFYARHYEGKLLIRFDDTNPSKEKDEFEQSIIQDLARLGVVGDSVSHSSDYFDEVANIARKMIRDGNAFMDDTPQEQMREEREKRVDSKRRSESIETNLSRFETMLGGGDLGRPWCMRAKINMQDNNGTLRDPVLFRCNETPHHRTGTKYKAYPTYDFVCPILDAHEGVTHALRTNEYHDRNAQYAWIQTALGLRKVFIVDISRLNFVYTLLSKRKLAWFVDEGKVEGWYDPRFPTVQGVLRRGVALPALREFILGQGASNRVLDMEWDKFWAINKKHIDPTAERYTAISDKGRIRVKLFGPGLPSATDAPRVIPRHPKNAELGLKDVFLSDSIWIEAEDARDISEGEEVTLMKWGNAIIRGVGPTGSSPSSGEPSGELHLEGDFKKTRKITWLADLPSRAPLIPLRLVDYDFLIRVPKLDEGDDFEAAVNPETMREELAWGETSMATLSVGTIVQLERKDYFRVDRAYNAKTPTEPMVLILVPDGRPRSWGVSSAAAKAAAEPKEVKGAKSKK